MRVFTDMDKLDQRIQLVASTSFSKTVDQWRRSQSDLPSRSEAIRRLVHLGLTFDQENPMRMITAIIRPHKYEEVREALVGLGIEGITVTQVKGFGRQRGKTEIYRGAEYETVEIPKLRLEIAVRSCLERCRSRPHRGTRRASARLKSRSLRRQPSKTTRAKHDHCH